MKQITVKHQLERVSERIKTRRRYLNLTQEQLAEYSELSPNYIARIELGSKTPSLSTFFRIAKALQINPADLVSEEPLSAPSYSEQIIHALSGLEDNDSIFVLEQLRNTTDFLKHNR